MPKHMNYIEGRCKARSILHRDDYCNKPAIRGGEYCDEHTCVIPGCKEHAGVEYPLLPGNPRFCSKHHNPEYAGKYGCDFSPSDAEMDMYRSLGW